MESLIAEHKSIGRFGPRVEPGEMGGGLTTHLDANDDNDSELLKAVLDGAAMINAVDVARKIAAGASPGEWEDAQLGLYASYWCRNKDKALEQELRRAYTATAQVIKTPATCACPGGPHIPAVTDNAIFETRCPVFHCAGCIHTCSKKCEIVVQDPKTKRKRKGSANGSDLPKKQSKTRN